MPEIKMSDLERYKFDAHSENEVDLNRLLQSLNGDNFDAWYILMIALMNRLTLWVMVERAFKEGYMVASGLEQADKAVSEAWEASQARAFTGAEGYMYKEGEAPNYTWEGGPADEGDA